MKKLLFVMAFGLLSISGIPAQNVSAPSYGEEIHSRHKMTNPPVAVNLETDSVLHLTNLVIFIRFADDEEIMQPFERIDSMFNCKTPNQISVYNYFKASTYGKILFHTVYAGLENGNRIVSYVDKHPRGYYQPYSDSNTIGYKGEQPFIGITMREAQLLAAAMHHVDSLHLVDSSVVLDGNGDGYIDNVSFIVKGDVGFWNSLLWPHMEYFPQDSIDYPVNINGAKPNVFNFEFEGSPSNFQTMVFCHEMYHSLGLPDLYHFMNYTNVRMSGVWDVMGEGSAYIPSQTNIMLKNRFLHICEPVEITEDGSYTLLSNGNSPERNCYYIKSALDSMQWYAMEFRNNHDCYDKVDASGMLISRWNERVYNEAMSGRGTCFYTNAFFDNDKQQHLLWIFRPGSASDTVAGQLWDAIFPQRPTRRSFGPKSDPFPYLADGRPEESFEITDIYVKGDSLTFNVHFFRNDTLSVENHHKGGIRVYPNPASEQLTVQGQAMSSIEVYSALGQQLCRVSPGGSDYYVLPLDAFPTGLLLLRVTRTDGSTEMLKVVKR